MSKKEKKPWRCENCGKKLSEEEAVRRPDGHYCEACARRIAYYG